jgi:hypothetical protein
MPIVCHDRDTPNVGADAGLRAGASQESPGRRRLSRSIELSAAR